MKNTAIFGRLVAVGMVMGGIAGAGMTSAQAARNVEAFSSYDPEFAYTGDPAYAPRAQAVEQNEHIAPVKAPHFRAPAPVNEGGNLPYSDRPYGDPDSW